MQTSAMNRTLVTRSRRIEGQPARFRNYVKFYSPGNVKSQFGGQFGDVSFSGMRLLARQNNRVKMGDLLDLEFTLPGSDDHFKVRAQVVRCESEFQFALHFVHFEDEQQQNFKAALAVYNSLISRSHYTWLLLDAKKWIWAHRRGLLVFAVGLFLATLTTYWILNSSDEFLGHSLRSWSNSYPKQWDWDYVNKSN